MKKTRSIKWRLVIPFCLILIFQTIFMMAFLSTGNVAQSLYQTEIRSLKKDVENSELLLEEAGKEGGDPDYFSELQKDELILGLMMGRAKAVLPPRTSTYDVVIIEYLKKVVPVEAASWEEAKMLVNEAWDNGTYVLTADDFAGVNFTLGR